jgi:rRNA-processing protein FCF1
MKVAVTDACIFIDLFQLNLVNSFFELDCEFHTTIDVINELYPIQKKALSSFIEHQKLFVHAIDELERLWIFQHIKSNSLSEADKSVLYIAQKLNAIVLSSDKVLRKFAANFQLPYHGLLWIIDALVEQEKLSKLQAKEKLTILLSQNFIYQNNAKLKEEIEKRMRGWS